MMSKKVMPKYSDSKSKMYKPPFVPHPKEICQNLKKRYTSNIKNNIKSLTPSRNNDITG